MNHMNVLAEFFKLTLELDFNVSYYRTLDLKMSG